LSYHQHLVGRDGVEPSQSQTGDLQSLGLATCSVSPLFRSIISYPDEKVKSFLHICNVLENHKYFLPFLLRVPNYFFFCSNFQ